MGQTLPQPLKSGPGPQRGPRGQHHRSLDSVQRAVHGGENTAGGGGPAGHPCGVAVSGSVGGQDFSEKKSLKKVP